MTEPLPINQRLYKGAEILGKFYRAGKRCMNGWAGICLDPDEAKSGFCRAKLQWLALAAGESDRDLSGVESEFGLVEAMKLSELDASGLTITLDTGLKIGPTGSLSPADAGVLAMDPSTAKSIVKILETFPKSRVTQV